MLDYVFALIAGAPMIVAMFMVLPLMDERLRPGLPPLPPHVIILFVTGLLTGLAWGIFNWILISKTGQTVGKRIVGIRIVKTPTGELPGFLHGVVLRIWVMGLITSIPYLGGCIALIDYLFIFGQERRCLHDYIASTKVIVAR
jgi:uncharacterized RDD family membrane protein YckC